MKESMIDRLDAILYAQNVEMKAFRIVLQCALERVGRADADGREIVSKLSADSLGAAGRLKAAPGETEAEIEKERAALSASIGKLFAEVSEALTPPSQSAGLQSGHQGPLARCKYLAASTSERWRDSRDARQGRAQSLLECVRSLPQVEALPVQE